MYATFGDDRLRGSGVAIGVEIRISHFPIDLHRRLYNTLALALPCECDHAQLLQAELMLTNPRDAFTGQSRSPNMVPFDVLGMVFY